jgi:putative ABC transport system permease protein
MSALLRRLLHLVRRARHDAELAEEMESHRAHRQDAFEREGLDRDAAEHASRRAMGNVALAVEDTRDVWALRAIDSARQDIRDSLRGLRRSPGFALAVVGTLALGIGANTALFSIFNSLILRPLPVHDPASLAMLTDGSWPYPVWEEIRARKNELFDGAFAWSAQRFDLSQGGRALPVDGAYVSGTFFDDLGVRAARGRLLTPADDGAAPDGPVVVISHRFWREHFGGAEDIVGRRLTVQKASFTIVGVTPPGFFGVDVGRRTDVMIPFAAEPSIRGEESWLKRPSTWWLEIMVRLERGQSVDQATAVLRGIQPQIRTTITSAHPEPGATGQRYLADPFTLAPSATGASSLRGRFETPLFAMVVAVGLVLLVACANIASLLLARALARRHELSVRLALGGSSWRLARLLFTESLIVAIAGAALGLGLASWGGTMLVRQLDTWQRTVSLDLSLDWRVLAFTLVLACLSAIVAGIAPVFGLKSVAPGEALKDGGRAITGDRRFAARGTLVVAQLALSLVLVVAAGLFLRTFASLNRLPLGFVPEPLLVVELNLQSVGAPVEGRFERVERLRAAAASVPGVRSATVSAMRRLTGGGWSSGMVAVGEDPPPAVVRGRPSLWRDATTPGWFAAMGIPLRAGRDFEETDRLGSPNVAIVNDAFVRLFMPGRQPIGETIRIGGPGGAETRLAIVGLVGDTVYASTREGMVATMYVALAQRPPDAFWPSVLLTINAPPERRAAIERDVAAALTSVDPTVGLGFGNFDELVAATITQERLVTMLATFFGGLALLLAAIGLYGIVAHAVRARQTEISLRMALGARPAGIVRLVCQRVGVLILAGIGLGLVTSLWAARFVAPLLFEIDARDPLTFVAAAGVLLAVGVLAAWLPARRATRLDPASVLREG